MFKYTKEAILQVVEDIKKYCKIFKIGSLLFTTAYFIFVLLTRKGIFWVNLILASLFVIYTIFELATNKKKIKRVRKYVKRSYKWIKIGIKAFTLGSMLYGIYTATVNVSAFSTITITLMIILWILQFLLEIVIEIIENKVDLCINAIKQDIKDVKDTIKKPVKAITNGINKLRGKDIEPEPTKSKQLLKLEKRIKEKESIKGKKLSRLELFKKRASRNE